MHHRRLARHAVAQMPEVKAQIDSVLRRADYTEAQKIEFITTLLKSANVANQAQLQAQQQAVQQAQAQGQAQAQAQAQAQPQPQPHPHSQPQQQPQPCILSCTDTWGEDSKIHGCGYCCGCGCEWGCGCGCGCACGWPHKKIL